MRQTVQMEAVSAKDIAKNFFAEDAPPKDGGAAKPKAGGRRASFFKADKRAKKTDGAPSGFFYFMYLTDAGAKHDFRLAVRAAIRQHIRKASTVTPQASTSSLVSGGGEGKEGGGGDGKEGAPAAGGEEKSGEEKK